MGFVPEIVLVAIVNIFTKHPATDILLEINLCSLYKKTLSSHLITSVLIMTIKRTLEEDRLQKRQRVTGPPRHRERLMVRSRFSWQTTEGKKLVMALLLLDCRAMGPVLS
jgi:hypothetical protein